MLVFADFINTQALREIYRNIYVSKNNYPEINFYEPELGWNDYLPLETINELKLIQNQKKDIGLYLFLKKYSYEYYSKNLEYYLPEGLNKVGILINGSKTPQEMKELIKFVDIIRQNMEGKIVIFPKSLKYVWGDLIGDIKLKKLQLNEGLEYFNFNFSSNANIGEIEIPSSVIPFDGFHKQDCSKLNTIHFYGFDNSCFFDNIENLKKLLEPYIKITERENVHSVKKEYLYELTIDRIIIDFSNINFPGWITLGKEECRIFKYEYFTEKNIYELVAHINDLIMEKIAKYRGIKRRKLNCTPKFRQK